MGVRAAYLAGGGWAAALLPVRSLCPPHPPTHTHTPSYFVLGSQLDIAVMKYHDRGRTAVCPLSCVERKIAVALWWLRVQNEREEWARACDGEGIEWVRKYHLYTCGTHSRRTQNETSNHCC